MRYETRLGWVWVKPTKTRTIFFLTTRLKIVRYACYPKNCERFNRFENKKSSSPLVRTAALRASQSNQGPTQIATRRAQRAAAAGRGAGAGVGLGGLKVPPPGKYLIMAFQHMTNC